MHDRVSKIEKLRKLLALASSPNRHEAEAAGKAADRYMRRHHLTEYDVARADADAYCEVSLGVAGWSANWRFVLVTLAAREHGAEAVALQYGSRRKVKICGARSSVEKARRLYERLEEHVKKLEVEAAREYGEELAAMRFQASARQISDSFRRGAVMGLARLYELAKLRRESRPADPEESSKSRETSQVEDKTKAAPTAPCTETALVRSTTVASRASSDHSERVKERYAPKEKPVDVFGNSDPILFDLGARFAMVRSVVGPDGDVMLKSEKEKS